MGKVDPNRITRRSVEAKTDAGLFEMQVYVNAKKVQLTPVEQKNLTDYLTDCAMRAIASAPYIGVPLSRIKAR